MIIPDMSLGGIEIDLFQNGASSPSISLNLLVINCKWSVIAHSYINTGE